MNLDDIPNGSLCVIDTNILLYAEQGVSGQAQRLISRCSRGEITGILPSTVWQELTHKLMLAEAIMMGLVTGGNPAARLAQKPEAVRSLSLYREKVRSLTDLGLRFEACTRKDLLETAFDLQGKYGLLTNDSIVLAAVLRLKADVLVSNDKQLRDIEEPAVHYPTDLRF